MAEGSHEPLSGPLAGNGSETGLELRVGPEGLVPMLLETVVSVSSLAASSSLEPPPELTGLPHCEF